jgi:hypothetical protein
MSNAERGKIRQARAEDLPDGRLTDPAPFLCYITIDALDYADLGKPVRRCPRSPGRFSM